MLTHTTWRFAKKTQFFRLVLVGWHCAVAPRFALFQGQNYLTISLGKRLTAGFAAHIWGKCLMFSHETSAAATKERKTVVWGKRCAMPAESLFSCVVVKGKYIHDAGGLDVFVRVWALCSVYWGRIPERSFLVSRWKDWGRPQALSVRAYQHKFYKVFRQIR